MKIKIYLILFLFTTAFDLLGQDSFSKEEIQNILSYDSLVNLRIEQYQRTRYNLGLIDTLITPDTLLIVDEWNLEMIYYKLNPSNPDYKILKAYLEYFKAKGIKFNIRYGYNPDIPNVKDILEAEKQSGKINLRLTFTAGCLIDKRGSLLIKYIAEFNKLP